MGLTVLSVAYPLTEVGADAVGGSEQILTILDSALTQAGHHSLVLAAEGSRVNGTLIRSPRATGKLDDATRVWGAQVHRQLLSQTLRQYAVDLVHMHSLDFHTYIPDPPVPVLATMHLPCDWYPPHIFQSPRPNFYLNCVSQSQLASCPTSASLLKAIPNGVDVKALSAAVPRGAYALAMGRICPEKGFHNALKAAHLAGVSLKLAGEVFPYQQHLKYFREEIEPLLDQDRQFVGPVNFQQKRMLLAGASCLLVCSTVAETSCLVAMEALACGTPVIALRVGALPEIVEPGRTGYLVSGLEEMASAMKEVQQLSPDHCRNAAATRFDARRMVRDYLNVYSELAMPPTKRRPSQPEGLAAGLSVPVQSL